MKNTLSKFLSIGLIAIGLAACGSSTTVPLPSTGITGSASVATGLITFSGSATYNPTMVLAGPLYIPQYGLSGNYGQIAVGGATTAFTGSTGVAGQIQYQQKAPGNWGQFEFGGMTDGVSNLTFNGQIQLNPSLMQEIIQTYGQAAQVTQIGLWVTQSVLPSSSYGGYQQYGVTPTFSGTIASAVVYLYINGSSTPVGPILF